MWRYGVMWFGIASAASAVLFIKASNMPPVTLAWMRLLIAAIALTPVMLYTLRRTRYRFTRVDLLASLPGAVLLALHFVTWIIGVRQTTAANSTLIVNLLPVAMPFAMFIAERQRIGRFEIVGTILALVGVLVLSVGGLDFSGPQFRGDLWCALAMLLAVAYMTFGRIRGRGRPILVYIVPLYWIATPIAFCFSLGELDAYPPINTHEVLMVLGLGLIPTVIGHSISNWSMVNLPSQVVAICNLGQFIVAAILAAILLHEYPTLRYFPAAALVIAGAVVVIRSAPRPVTRAIEAAQAQTD